MPPSLHHAANVSHQPVSETLRSTGGHFFDEQRRRYTRHLTRSARTAERRAKPHPLLGSKAACCEICAGTCRADHNRWKPHKAGLQVWDCKPDIQVVKRSPNYEAAALRSGCLAGCGVRSTKTAPEGGATARESPTRIRIETPWCPTWQTSPPRLTIPAQPLQCCHVTSGMNVPTSQLIRS